MKRYTYLLLVLALLASACKKDFLDIRPNKRLLVPNTLADIQTLLDNINIMNPCAAMSTFAADEFSLTDNSLNRATAPIPTAYLWQGDNYQGAVIAEWSNLYEQVFYANIALDGLKDVVPTDLAKHGQLKGAAYFYRAMAMYQLAQLFAKPYHPSNLEAPGLPYPLESDVNIRPGRGLLKNLYSQLITDLKAAGNLLPAEAAFKNRPAKLACYMLLARIYLIMADYDNALGAAQQALAINNKLLDFNLAKPGFTPFADVLPNGNDEVAYYQKLMAYGIFNLGVTLLDQELDRSFQPNDLRRNVLFFDGGNKVVYFAGYQGLTTAEMYLIQAECLARANQPNAAMGIVNQLCTTRFKTGTFTPYTANSTEAAMAIIISERRKELFARGLRWTDLRRLNFEPTYAITLKRSYNGKEYTLAPNAPAYVFKIPDNEIQTSGIEQN